MIRAGNAPTRQQLMEATQASKSSFRRDIDHFRTFFGAPIVYCAKRNGYIYDPTEPAFEMPGLWMSPSELHALLSCEQILESMQPGLLSSELEPLKSRLRRMLSASGHNHTTIARKIRLSVSSSRHPDPGRFSIVAEATLRELQLVINYIPRTRDITDQDGKERLVEPKRLVRYRDNWLLIAWCHLRCDLRTFSVDLIRQPRIGSTSQHTVDEDTLDSYANNSFGIFSGAATNYAVLVFEAEPAKWVADEKWHPEQVGRHLSDGGYELKIPYSDNRELVMEILKYGAGVEVIGPLSLRKAVGEKLRSAASRY